MMRQNYNLYTGFDDLAAARALSSDALYAWDDKIQRTVGWFTMHASLRGNRLLICINNSFQRIQVHILTVDVAHY